MELLLTSYKNSKSINIAKKTDTTRFRIILCEVTGGFGNSDIFESGNGCNSGV